MKTLEEISWIVDDGDLDDAYFEYIEREAVIGNGTMLINAYESGDYFDAFVEEVFDNQDFYLT